MSKVIVAVLNNKPDYNILHNQLWYRIPVSSQQKWLDRHWPPRWLAFYQTKLFGPEKYAIHYYGQVVDIQLKYRWELLDSAEKRNRRYYQIFLKSVERLSRPIQSYRRRRIAFIGSTWRKFMQAEEINDLYDDSPLEDSLWQEMKKHNIRAERQEVVQVNRENFMLDFAIYCANGKIGLGGVALHHAANPDANV